MRLHEYIAANMRKPFKYGSHDCVLFAIGWLNVATGRDYLSCLPKWGNEAEALTVIESVGGLAAAVDRELKRIDPGMARDGDIAMRQGGLCIFSGSHIVTTGIDKLLFADRSEAECAWSLL